MGKNKKKNNKTNKKTKTKPPTKNNDNNKRTQTAGEQPDNFHQAAAKISGTISSSEPLKVSTAPQSKNGRDDGTDALQKSNDENQVVHRHRHHRHHHRNVYNDKQINPLLHQQQIFLNSIPKSIRTNFFSDSTNATITPQIRAEIWSQQADIGEELINRYSWSTPDARALRILKYYNPIVEIGCGTNAYWCGVMKKLGMDVVGYDASPLRGGKIKRNVDNDDNNKHDTVQKNKKKTKQKQKGKKRRRDEDANIEEDDDKHDYDDKEEEDNNEFRVRFGGPEVLSTKSIRESGRTLFLCYPDEEDMVSMIDEEQNTQQKQRQSPSVYNHTNDEKHYVPTSLGAQCLEHYTGQYIIHVGELYPDTLSYDQAPWGRSSSCEFQQRLASEFHCLLKAKLTNWLHVRDTISVWKRSERCTMIFQGDNDDDDDEEEEEEVEYRHIPSEEMLPSDVAAPCAQHLLEWEENANSNDDESIVPRYMNDEKLDAESDGVNVSSSNESKKRKKKKRKKPSNTKLKTVQDVNDGVFSENTADGRHTSSNEEN